MELKKKKIKTNFLDTCILLLKYDIILLCSCIKEKKM